ncbi:hypothetical protein PJF56_18755 [Roseofilum sp. BLCC_M91]|uniref:Uncharacterized protein n=1 Tax=Roseofilum halophilum BLCC-M91 TaxID=3022259 RepID=A0ABT7BPA5_9CYAN|nr:hypothetical protein [Roseofilum halophilum]MDJ1180905.1 hypothetical protein [Roseofilum halophilum BLCC-M91]
MGLRKQSLGFYALIHGYDRHQSFEKLDEVDRIDDRQNIRQSLNANQSLSCMTFSIE